MLAPLAGYQQHWQHWLDVEGGEVFIHCPTPDLTPEAWNLGKTLPSIRCTVAAAAIWRYGDMKGGRGEGEQSRISEWISTYLVMKLIAEMGKIGLGWTARRHGR